MYTVFLRHIHPFFPSHEPYERGNDVSPPLSVEKSRRKPIEMSPEYVDTLVCS